MEDLTKLYQLVRRGGLAILFILVFVIVYTVYDMFFGTSRIVEQFRENNNKLEQVITKNQELEKQLLNVRNDLGMVHKSLLESQLKMTGLIKSTKGTTSELRNNANEMEAGLSTLIHEIDSVLNLQQ